MTDAVNSDELSVFVSSPFRAIAAGIADVQDTKIASAHGTGVFGHAAPENVEFDIAVSAKNTGGANGGLKIAVFGISAGTAANIGAESSTVSRIKFSIPTRFKKNPDGPISVHSTKTAQNQK